MKMKTEEGKIDYNYWYKFDKKIPHVMRFKEFHIIDDHILYWITQEYFEEADVRHFFDVFEDFHSNLDTAFVICRDETSWNYEKDLKDGTGAFMTLEDGYTMWNESIEVKEEVKVPGTNVVLEKGDKVRLVSKKDESKGTIEIIFEDANFEFITYMNTDVYGHTYKTYDVRTKRNSKADDFVIEIRIDKAWKTWEPENIQVAYGLPGARKSITEFIKVLQDSLKFADKVAAYLKVKVINR